ncbi:hypothetical protein GYMLUDRAFT_242784 [Collybiopsis luxurians FD-317 M1]|uniref:Major facilitator superfamily (MFS) profile domain-containing protein n=1 Tax=Collybiopsis luxurians FD-317 M1 TaxID=944289 RepID=A0A0D0CIW4_9AGAR|nr:hypothetical protein GYMLUDRAFT_242784 [Collybiopsis luxurians FD-317 M1]
MSERISEKEDQVEISAALVYPAGKTKAWLTVLGCFLIQFSTVASLNSFGVFEDFYASRFLSSSSASRISWIIGLELLLELGLGTVGGKLCDLGYSRVALATGSIIYLVSFFLLSLAKEDRFYQVILAQGLGMGIGIGLLYVPALVTAARHFPTRQALAMGIVMSSGSLGGGIFSIMLNHLIPKYGFPSGVRGTAYFSLGLLTIGNFLVTVLPPTPKSEVATGKTNLLYTPYMLTVLSGCVGQLGGLFPLNYIQLFADSHHTTKGFAFYSIAAMTFSTAFGRFIPAYFADKYGIAGTYLLCGYIFAGSAFLMFAASSPGGLFVFCILYGFFYGSISSLYPSVVTVFVPSEADKGKLVGVAIAPIGIVSLVSSPLGGKLIGDSGDYQWWKGIVWTGALLTAAGIIQVVARQIHIKKVRSIVS